MAYANISADDAYPKSLAHSTRKRLDIYIYFQSCNPNDSYILYTILTELYASKLSTMVIIHEGLHGHEYLRSLMKSYDLQWKDNQGLKRLSNPVDTAIQ